MAEPLRVAERAPKLTGIRPRPRLSVVSSTVREVNPERSFPRDLDENPTVFLAYMLGCFTALAGAITCVQLLVHVWPR